MSLARSCAVVSDKLRLKTARETVKDSDHSRVIHLRVESSLNVTQLTDGDRLLSVSEGYVLDVAADQQRVVVTGASSAGVFYGLQSLLSLLAASADQRTVPAVGRRPR